MTEKVTPSSSEGDPSSKDIQATKKDTDPSQDDSLPPLSPLDTKTPVQLNQQLNFYQQIPTTAWDSLSSDQNFELSKHIIETANIIDERHFKYAMDQQKNVVQRTN